MNATPNSTSKHGTTLIAMRVVLHLLCIVRKPWDFGAVRFHTEGILREL
jgi:hypothetical protein